MLKRIVANLIAVTASLALAGIVSAQNFTEIGDAGQTLGTAQATAASPAVAGMPLASITGSLFSIGDADIFAIYINSPSTFSATTVNAVTTTANTDTALFLFDSTGKAIYANDDAAGGLSVGSSLPANNPLGPQVVGVYYLAISLSGNEPVNFASQLMFMMPTTSTDLRGPNSQATGGLFAFDANGVNATVGGNYRIDLTGAQTSAVPEPSTVALAVFGALGLISLVKKRRA